MSKRGREGARAAAWHVPKENFCFYALLDAVLFAYDDEEHGVRFVLTLRRLQRY